MLDQPPVVEPAEPMLKPVIEGPEEERAADQAAAIEDAGEEERRGLGQQRAVDVDERDGGRRSKRGHSDGLIAWPSGASLTHRPIRAESSPGLGRLGRLGDHPDDRLGVAGPDVHPAVVPVEPEAVATIGRASGKAAAIRSQRPRHADLPPAVPIRGDGYWSLTIAEPRQVRNQARKRHPVAASRSRTSAIADETVADDNRPAGRSRRRCPRRPARRLFGDHPLDDVDLAHGRAEDRTAAATRQHPR